MKKILLMLTGGTICSFVGDSGFKDANAEKASPVLTNNFKKSDSQYKNTEFDIISPLNILSENMRINDWNLLLESLKKVDFSAYKGIIIAHGTDTLAYTAALLSLLLSGIEIPTVLVSSQLPLSCEGANGNENFKNAVEIIEKGITPGVYVVYRNENGVTYIHKGRDIKQCFNYSNDFYSKTMLPVKNQQYLKSEKSSVKLLHNVKEFKNEVLVIEPYVGIDYSVYNIKGKRIVLHGTYHSSTACVAEGESCVIDFIKKCHNEGVLFVLSAFQPELLEDDGVMYSSTGKILAAGAEPISGLTSEMVYAKALTACAIYEDNAEMLNFLRS